MLPIHDKGLAIDNAVPIPPPSVFNVFYLQIGLTGEALKQAKKETESQRQCEIEYHVLPAQLGAIVALTDSALARYASLSVQPPFSRLQAVFNGVHERPGLDWIDSDGVGYETLFTPVDPADGGSDPTMSSVTSLPLLTVQNIASMSL